MLIKYPLLSLLFHLISGPMSKARTYLGVDYRPWSLICRPKRHQWKSPWSILPFWFWGTFWEVRIDPESSGRFPSTFDMTSSSEEWVKMAPNRGTADRACVIENYRWPIVAASAPMGETTVKLNQLDDSKFHKVEVYCASYHSDPVWQGVLAQTL